MATEVCPVCKGAAVHGGDSDHGERSAFSCPRCGDFQITATALAMLDGRLDGVANRYARLSYSIRRQQGVGKEWFLVTSANIDELVKAPLPNFATQLGYLVRWIASKLGDDNLGAVPLPHLDDLAGILGPIDGTRVEQLLRHAQGQGLVDLSKNNDIALTAGGWTMIDTLTTADRPQPEDASAGQQPDQLEKVQHQEIVKAHCNQCGGERNAIVQARHAVPGNDGCTSSETVTDILECRGCQEISVRQTYWFSEWETMSQDPVTGEPVRHMPEKVTYWPAKQARPRPKWRNRIPDANLRQVMDEVYAAVDHNLVVLAAIGARTLLDRAMFLMVGDQKNGFRGKLDEMVAAGKMGTDERDIFLIMVDLGSASAHRAHIPDAPTLDSVLTAVETLLNKLFVLPSEAKAVSAKTPKRGQP